MSGGPGAENHRGGTSRIANLEAPPARAPANSAANVEAGSSLRFSPRCQPVVCPTPAVSRPERAPLGSSNHHRQEARRGSAERRCSAARAVVLTC